MVSTAFDQETLVLLHDEMLKHHIEVHYQSGEEAIVHGYSNEIKHVLINLINNAKDAFNRRNSQYRSIKISIKSKTQYFGLIVQDNAGGIKKYILEDIFKPYISTKQAEESSGIGLYMSQFIMQKYNGKISAKNIDNGAKFTIKFYKKC